MISTGIIEPDLRGRHLNQPQTDPQIIKSIIEHINSFARIESYYCRAGTQREYTDGDVNQAEMYRLYKQSCQDKGIPYAKQHKYEEKLNTKFNIRGFQQQKRPMFLLRKLQKPLGRRKNQNATRDGFTRGRKPTIKRRKRT